jgi:cell division septal protein FtsQ
MKTLKSTETKSRYNYYDRAPEHNERINERGWRYLIIIIFVVVLCGLILLAFWLWGTHIKP